MIEVRKSKKGILVTWTSTINGMLEQGGLSNAKCLVKFGALDGKITPECKLNEVWNELMTVEGIVADLAVDFMKYGQEVLSASQHKFFKILRKGQLIS